MRIFEIEKIIKNALVEDMNNGDITTENLVDDTIEYYANELGIEY